MWENQLRNKRWCWLGPRLWQVEQTTDSGNSWGIEIPQHFVWIWEREISPEFLAGAAARIVVPFTEIVLKGTGLKSKLYVYLGFWRVWGDFYILKSEIVYTSLEFKREFWVWDKMWEFFSLHNKWGDTQCEEPESKRGDLETFQFGWKRCQSTE